MSEYKIKKSTLWQMVSGILLIVLVASIFTGGFGIVKKGNGDTNGGTDAAPTQPTGQPTEPEQPTTANLKVEADDVVKGKANAPVTIFEYSDISCPFCAAAEGYNQEVLDYLKSNSPSWTPTTTDLQKYVDDGKVRLVFRYFPGHGSGANEMKLLFCANEQGKFWESKDKLFENWAGISEGTKTSDAVLGTIAGLDLAKAKECAASGKYDSKLTKDTNSGRAAGVQGTPAFFVNGELLSGAQPASAMNAMIESKLK